MSKKVRNLLFMVYTIVVLLILGILTVAFMISTQIKQDGAGSFFGNHFTLMDTDFLKPTISKGNLVISKSIDPQQIKEGDLVTYRYLDANQNEQVTTGAVAAVDQIANPPSYMITGYQASGTEIIDADSIIGKAESYSKFLGGCFGFFVTTNGLYYGFLLPAGILLLSEVLLLVLLLRRRNRAEEVAEDSEQFENPHDYFKVEIAAESSPEQTPKEPKQKVVPADEVLPPVWKQPATAKESESLVVDQSKSEVAPQEVTSPSNLEREEKEDDLSSVLASMLEQESASLQEKAPEQQDPAEPVPEKVTPDGDASSTLKTGFLEDESSEDIINGILKKLYGENSDK